jgi:hypothetical protein
LPHGDATLQQEGADLNDGASALTDQPLTHAVKRLRIELLGGLCRDELHGRALHCHSDGLRIAEIVFLPLRIGAHVLRQYQASVMPKHSQLTAEMVRPHASLHAD